MKETLIAGDGKPSDDDPKPLPKPPVKLWEYLLLKYETK